MPFLSFYNPFAVPPSPVRMARISHNKQQHVDQKRQEKWLVHRQSPSPHPISEILVLGAHEMLASGDVQHPTIRSQETVPGWI